MAGFEPTAPRTQSECATKLRHTPFGPQHLMVRCRQRIATGYIEVRKVGDYAELSRKLLSTRVIHPVLEKRGHRG